MSNDTEESVTEESAVETGETEGGAVEEGAAEEGKAEAGAVEEGAAEEGKAEAGAAEEGAVTGKFYMDCPDDLMDDTFSSKVFPAFVVVLGAAIVLFAAHKYCQRASGPAITAPEAAFFCTAFLAGSLLIVTALAMVRSRTAAERRIKNNWYKDQLDDYLARKDRPSNSTRTQ